jgi:tetratricopeptide (TPR) repeat protein
MRAMMMAWTMVLAMATGATRGEETPAVEAAIPEVVKALPAPAMQAFPNGIRMAVSSTSEVAQRHVLQGLNHLHGGWEFEASRHFAVALRTDPECLLAHWGMVMALLNPTPETGPARNAASDRLLSLIEAGKGTELERGYAYGLVKYFEEGPVGAATAFRKVADRFPNEMQASVFAALFNRGGYDAAGDPTADQEGAEKRLFALMERNPDSTVPLNALLTVRAEAPDLAKSLELARSLCRMAPDYAPYFHLSGHYEWRCGNHGAAALAFGKAAGFYQKWMRENKADIADCPEWIRAETYRIVAITSRGEFDIAYAAARQLAARPVPEGRPASPGARFLLWDAKTLPARVLLHRGFKGNAQEAAASLPSPEEIRPLHPHTLAYWWIDGLRIALETQRLLDIGKVDEARIAADALTKHGESMARLQKHAATGGERSAWLRSFRALEVLASDLRGKVAMAGPEDMRGAAFNWFSSAADRQLPSPLLLPPMLLTPMATRLGEYRLATRKPAEAVESYQRALRAFPNDVSALDGLARAQDAAGDAEMAGQTRKLIGELKSH